VFEGATPSLSNLELVLTADQYLITTEQLVSALMSKLAEQLCG
jgi:hypothetical protein